MKRIIVLLGIVMMGTMIFMGCSKKEENAVATKKKASATWLTTWSQAHQGIGSFPQDDTGHTVEYTLPIQNDGRKTKLTFSNFYGEEPLTIKKVSVSANQNKNYQEVTFNKKVSFVLNPQESKKSDAIPLKVNAKDQLYVRVYYAKADQANRPLSGALMTNGTRRSVTGDETLNDNLTVDKTIVDPFPEGSEANKYANEMAQYQMHFSMTISGVDVLSETGKGTIVAFGDSITQQQMWTKPLAQSIYKTYGQEYGVVNQGISGNRLLKSIAGIDRRFQYFGVSGLERFGHDVFSVNQNVSHVIVALGVNDIHQPGVDAIAGISELPTANELIKGYEELIEKAHDQNAKIYFATITPFIGYAKDVENAKKEEIRQTVNTWIRENKEADGYFDFDQAVRDPADESKLAEKYSSGDSLHPNEAGGKAIAKTIDMKAFK